MASKLSDMKKVTILFIFICLFIGSASAQATYQYRYHVFDDYLLNPAYVGSKDYYPILFGRDQRFSGLSDGTPQSYFLSLHSRVGEGYVFAKDGKINQFFDKFGSIAMGLQFVQYNYGPHSLTNFGFTYGYHLDLNPNFKTKRPRHLVFALTPRVQIVGYNMSKLTLISEALGETSTGAAFSDPALENGGRFINSVVFTSDVATLYQTIFADFGFTALNFVQTKNKLESDYLFVNDSTSYATYDSLYSTKFMVNTKLKFIDLYNSSMLDVTFIPSIAAMYGPKTKSSEYYLDLRFESVFKKHIAGIRSEVILTNQLGVNIHHIREYGPATYIQPYITFDFHNYTIIYAQNLLVGNDIIRSGAARNGFQVSVQLKLSKDRVVRNQRIKSLWKK